ncbi:MAG: hypothetical protein ACI8PG_001651 [Planctomycetota bacterium]|jgi:uncharacterized protein YbjT (DUF2867 family)
MILITGATGRIGRAVVRLLLTQHGIMPRVFVRDSERANDLLPTGVVCFQGDFDDRSSLVPALEGVDRVLLVSPANPRQVEWQNNVVRAAGANTHIVKISGLGTGLESHVDSGRWHAETEAEIIRSGRPYTFFRPYCFMQNFSTQINRIRESGIIKSGAGRARIAMVDVEDMAEVVVQVLSGQMPMRNEVHALTGPAALSSQEVAEVFSEVLGRRVVYQPQVLGEIRQALEHSGLPAWRVDLLLQFNRAFSSGLASEVGDTVYRVLGRPPRSLRQFLASVLKAQRDMGSTR